MTRDEAVSQGGKTGWIIAEISFGCVFRVGNEDKMFANLVAGGLDIDPD